MDRAAYQFHYDNDTSNHNTEWHSGQHAYSVRQTLLKRVTIHGLSARMALYSFRPALRSRLRHCILSYLLRHLPIEAIEVKSTLEMIVCQTITPNTELVDGRPNLPT